MTLGFPIIKESDLKKGTRVLLRLDLNLPTSNTSDDFRIKAIYPTLNLLQSAKTAALIVSHAASSLKPVAKILERDFPVKFLNSLDEAEKSEIGNGQFGLMENIRLEKGETSNDLVLAKRLAKLGDLFINEAFSASHRFHASIVGVPKFIPAFAGPLFAKEVINLSEAFQPKKRPALMIIGGAKFATKLPLVEKFTNIYDQIFVGGALANDLFKAKGMTIGQSRVSENHLDLSAIVNQEKIILPTDVVAVSGYQRRLVKIPGKIAANEKIVDAGEKTLQTLKNLVSQAGFIVWNGPLGIYEDGFTATTADLARWVAFSQAFSIVGGGNTLAVIKKIGLMDKFSFISTGGGAMLEFLARGSLPGIEALKNATQ
jgi:phosphoglycerate kinase